MIFKRSYISKLLAGALVVLVTACMKTITLQNGRTKVPAKSDVYKNREKFDISLLNLVNTNVIYERFNKDYNVLQRLDTHIETSIYGAYRFYPDGRFNLFFLDRNKPNDPNAFNPEYSGKRGVYYSEKDQIRYDLFAEINQWGWTGKQSGTFRFSGDTLYVQRDEFPKELDIYIKRELSPGYLNYNADW